MYHKQILVFLIIIISLAVSSKKFSCLKNTNNFKCKQTTITPYRVIANLDDAEVNIPDCEPKKIWLLIRHGTRYPGKTIFKMIEQLPYIQKTILNYCKTNYCPLNAVQLKHLADWNSTLSKNDQMVLTIEGQDELVGLGERYQSRFPYLMPEKYNNNTYKFKFTASQRTEASAMHFAIGLFGKHQSHHVWYPVAENEDPILRFYKACDKWQRDVKNNPRAYDEVNRFKNSSIITKMLRDMSNRFGFEFTYETAELIRKMCAFETAWSEESTSPWCDFMTLNEFEIMEFIHDLKYYWIDGYGYQLTYRHACAALIDMFNFMSTDNDAKVSAYFTHSGTVLKVLSLLGVAKDETPLLHNNYNTMKNRLWRTSIIDTFATNIAFVLYDCKLTGPSILVMHQERIVQLPGCPSGIPCPISTMKKNYPDEGEECNNNDICSVNV